MILWLVGMLAALCLLGAPVATDAPTTIPAGVTLPHQIDWEVLDRMGSGPLLDVCIDPGQGDLYLPEPTDYRGVLSPAGTEELGVYPGPRQAHAAIGLWREQARRCGGPGSSDHTGQPMELVVRQVSVAGTDEAWQAHLLMTVEGPELGTVTSFETVVRVGNAVYVERDSGFSAASTAGERGRADLQSVRAYVPVLAVFGED